MAVRIQLRRDTAANWVSSNPTLRAGEIGIETDTLKFKVGNGSSPWNSITAYANVVPGDLNTTLNGYLEVTDLGTENGPAKLDGSQNLLIPNDSIIFEGATEDAYELTLVAPDVVADKTVTLPNATTTLVGTDTTDTLTNKTLTSPVVSGLTLSDASIVFEGAVADSYETTLTVGEPTADRTLTLPDSTGTIATTSDISLNTQNIGLKTNNLEAVINGIESVTNVDTASDSDWKTLKYLIQMTYSGEIHSTEVIIANDGSNLLISQYGDVFSNTELATVTADKTSGIINLKVTPVSGKTPLSVRFFRTGIKS